MVSYYKSRQDAYCSALYYIHNRGRLSCPRKMQWSIVEDATKPILYVVDEYLMKVETFKYRR